MTVSDVQLTVGENSGPGLIAAGTDNLFYQTGHYIWNPTGDPWSFADEASDVSGVCSMSAVVNGTTIHGPASTPETDEFQQCPSPQGWGTGATVDTQQYVPTSGPLNLVLSATNAAGVTTNATQTIEVDNVQPSVSLAITNDSNPGGWAVNHAVTVTATPHVGPSGLKSLTCSVDGGTPTAYPTGGVSVNGNGSHTVTCTATNNAVDPQGANNTGSASVSIKIDEQSPTIAFLPQDPSNPAQVVVKTSDSESAVAGGQIQMAPQGSTDWTSVPTSFTSSGQLVATIPDAGLSGPYTIQASACSQVGNCGTASETLTMPLRVAATSDVSFSTIADPLVAKKVRERVLVGWHWAAVLRHGRAVKVKRGGHEKTITVIKYVEQCTHKRVRVGKHRWVVRSTCHAPRVTLRSTETVQHGQSVTVNGLLISSQGVPLTNAPVTIMAAPDNGLDQFTRVGSATTNAEGEWTATLPAGPSQIIEAVYAGSQTVLPASGQATVTVPSEVTIHVSSTRVAWGSAIEITGQVLGGYVPADSSLLRLDVGIGRIGHIVGLPQIDAATGRFVFVWQFSAGQGVIHPWFSVGTLSEAAFPYAPATSRRVVVTVGRATGRKRARRRVSSVE